MKKTETFVVSSFFLATFSFLVVLSTGCSQPETPSPAPRTPSAAKGAKPDTPAATMTIASEAFQQDQAIPKKHTEDGDDVSPSLSWSGLPEGTKELALIVDDPDAPTPEPWVHWVIYKIPATEQGLAEGVPRDETLSSAPAGALQGKNSWDTVGYRGPAPPKGHGVHHYHFKLYALDAELPLKPGLDKTALFEAINGHVLAEGKLIGTYER